MMKRVIMMLLLLFWLAPTSWAQSTFPTTPMVDPTCLKSPEVCQKRAAKKEEILQRCAADPDWCQQWRAQRMEQREERKLLQKRCKANPDKCKELRQQFREKKALERKQARKALKQAQQQWCTDNPVICEQWVAENKELDRKCQEMRRELEQKYPTRPSSKD